jgi:glycine/D-amino acid oxidase-like deaminating enzyme
MSAAGPSLSVAVIGAGAIGLATALHLQRDGHKVAMFDRGGPGEGASLGNSGIIAECEVIPLNRPATLKSLPRLLVDRNGPLTLRWSKLAAVSPWLIRFAWASRSAPANRSAQILSAMLPGAGRAWLELAASVQASDLLEQRGWLKVATSSAVVETLRTNAQAQARYGVSSNVLTGGEVCELEPGLAKTIMGGVFYPGLVSLRSPLSMMQALARRFIADGGTYHVCDVSEFGQDGDEVWIKPDSNLRFDRIVIAAGIWSKPLARRIGETIPLEAERGYHLMLRHPPLPLTRPVSVVSPGYTLAPMLDGLRLASGVEFAGVDAPPDMRRIERMAVHATTVVTGLQNEPLGRWLGFRPSVPDSIPIVRPSRRNPKFILAVGHGHLGITLAPWTAEAVSKIIADGIRDDDPVRP